MIATSTRLGRRIAGGCVAVAVVGDDIDRARAVSVLVEENVTDCKAVWYWAGVALPLKVSSATGVAAGDAVLVGEVERVAALQRAGRDRHRGTGQVGVVGSDRHARVDRHGRAAER